MTMNPSGPSMTSEPSPSDQVSGGRRIARLLSSARHEVHIIAPFIKVETLRLLLSEVRDDIPVHCVTRWKPREVAAGVSDPEVLDVLQARGNGSLYLVNRLHAKVFIADSGCLVGSANVTEAALGLRGTGSNIEILVEVPRNDPSVSSVLSEIDVEKREADALMAATVSTMAERLRREGVTDLGRELTWFPVSRQPTRAYRFYKRVPEGYLGKAEQEILSDLARADVQPGLSEDQFRGVIRSLLAKLPIAARLLDDDKDVTLAREDARAFFEGLATESWQADDLWRSFVKWMAHFYDDKIIQQEVVEVSLRRAQRI